MKWMQITLRRGVKAELLMKKIVKYFANFIIVLREIIKIEMDFLDENVDELKNYFVSS